MTADHCSSRNTLEIDCIRATLQTRTAFKRIKPTASTVWRPKLTVRCRNVASEPCLQRNYLKTSPNQLSTGTSAVYCNNWASVRFRQWPREMAEKCCLWLRLDTLRCILQPVRNVSAQEVCEVGTGTPLLSGHWCFYLNVRKRNINGAWSKSIWMSKTLTLLCLHI